MKDYLMSWHRQSDVPEVECPALAFSQQPNRIHFTRRTSYMGLYLSRPYDTLRRSVRLVLLPVTISVQLPSLLLDLALITVAVVPTAIRYGRSTAQKIARRQLADLGQKVRLLVHPMPGRILEVEVIPTAVEAVSNDVPRRTRIAERLERQNTQRNEAQGPGAFRGSIPFLHVPAPNDQPNWRLDRSHPPPDHYDGNYLVPPHFTVCPPMTALSKAYSNDPESHKWKVWETRDAELRSAVEDMMARHRVLEGGRYGLWICGSPEEVMYNPNLHEQNPAAHRDRMMVFMIELESAQRDKWFDMHEEMLALMVEVGIRTHHGVCIRYYLRKDSDEETENPWPESARPVYDLITRRLGGRATAAELVAAEEWVSEQFPGQASAERAAELLAARVEASREVARRRQRRDDAQRDP